MSTKRQRYRLLTGISYPPPDIVKRLLAGENIPLSERQMRDYPAGDVRSDIPAVSVPWLLERGRIEEVR